MNGMNDAVISALSEDECWSLLGRRDTGRLAVAAGREPDIFPVNYVTDGKRVLFRTAPGSKLAELLANPHVAFEVDEYDDTSTTSVVLKGIAKRLELQGEVDAADALPLTPWISVSNYRWVRIAPVSVTGRKLHRRPEPVRQDAPAPHAKTDDDQSPGAEGA
jgi:nitroimidazol reductase NimA-like FMN-containing flavoprotein (pyridoxamine 5'-phosphate oxidase superfamily)